MIFCVEDDSSIRELMIYALRSAGLEAAGFSEAGSFWAALRETKPDLVMLDIMLPGEDGFKADARRSGRGADSGHHGDREGNGV